MKYSIFALLLLFPLLVQSQIPQNQPRKIAFSIDGKIYPVPIDSIESLFSFQGFTFEVEKETIQYFKGNEEIRETIFQVSIFGGSIGFNRNDTPKTQISVKDIESNLGRLSPLNGQIWFLKRV